MSFINGVSDFTVSTSFQPSSTATQRFVQQYEQMLEDMLDDNEDAAGESVSRQVATNHDNLKMPLHSAVLTDQARDLAGAVTFTRSTPGCGTLADPSLESAGFRSHW